MDEPMFMSVNEFAKAIGIGHDRALEICRSDKGPPMIKNGRVYLVYRPTLAKWAEEAAAAKLQL